VKLTDEVPPKWSYAPLHEVIEDFQPGFASGEKNVEGGVPHLRMNNIGVSGELVMELVRTVPEKLAKPHHDLRSGDVLVCTTNSGKLVGKCAYFDIPGRYAFSNHLTRLRPKADVMDGKFLSWSLWLAWKRGAFEDKCKHWVNQSTLPRDALLENRVPLPPFGEQRRIVAKLEKLLGKVETCQQRLAKIPVLLKRFRQSVLGAACSGRLTADWREENNKDSADCLLKSLGVESLQKDDFDLQENWRWVGLGDIVQNYDGRRIPVKQSDRDKRPGPYPYYGAFGVIDCIDEYIYDGEYLLLAEDGKNLESRQRPISLIASGKFWVNNHAHVLQSKGRIPLQFLNIWLNSPTLDLMPFLTGIDQVKLNRSAMDRIPVPLPPLSEQQEIVRRVVTLFALADQIDLRFERARAQVEKLSQSVLAKAFGGELVPQDPNDESAEKVLEKIRICSNGKLERKHATKKN
jgi:restriction endonuclease S subunit